MPATPDPDLPITPPRRPSGPVPTLQKGRGRSPFVDAALWQQVPSHPPGQRSAFVRAALAAYLAAPDELGGRERDAAGRFQEAGITRTRVGVYVEDAQWEGLAALDGTIATHFEAALRRALENQ